MIDLLTTMLLNISDSITFPPKNAFIKYIQREKGQTRARFKPTAHRFLAYALTDKATWKIIRIHVYVQVKIIN